jgi:deoxyribodipyrimidine photo-lyase
MNSVDVFPPTTAAAQARLAAVRPGEYARSRNAINGAVTRLSPYLTHGLLTLPEVLAGVAVRQPLDPQHKLVFELGWREYFHHVWQHRGEAIFSSLHVGLSPDMAYADELPADIREARTGVPVIDMAVRSLYANGYLHNHARMWLASYCVHMRKVHWQVAADWMYGHLLDGDLASNHLSWQWVAATGSHKPYLFNAENVARYAPPSWHSPGSVIDCSYETLDQIARSSRSVGHGKAGPGIAEPALLRPADLPHFATAAPTAALNGRDIWLVHPWALRAPPADLPADTLIVGVCLQEFHQRWGWSAARWDFVSQRMTELGAPCWLTDRPRLAQALFGARSVQTVADPHLLGRLNGLAQFRPLPRLFAEVERPCNSFSQWWTRSMRDVSRVSDLPGLVNLSAGPLFDVGAAGNGLDETVSSSCLT